VLARGAFVPRRFSQPSDWHNLHFGGGDDYKTGSGISTLTIRYFPVRAVLTIFTPATYTFNNVAAGSYNLIVYTVTNNDGQLAEVNLSTGTTSGPATYFDTEQNGANFNGSFVLGSATTSGSATLANYVEFSRHHTRGGVFAISVPLSNSGAVGISGFQLQRDSRALHLRDDAC